MTNVILVSSCFSVSIYYTYNYSLHNYYTLYRRCCEMSDDDTLQHFPSLDRCFLDEL